MGEQKFSLDWVGGALQKRLAERRLLAIERAIAVVKHLSGKGVKARIVGSLAEGGFALHSDVDFLIEECPDSLRYSIEGGVEDLMLDIPFDVIYADEQKVG